MAEVDGVVMDVGVSSMQLDQAERGFSFRLGGPLDMRMGHDGPTAADVVAKASEADLANIIYIFGEERHSRAVARAIVAARKEAPITTTQALADIVGKVVRSKPNEIHPATRTFQGLRIFVNAELDELHLALAAAERVLKPGGRLVVVSFHSLEDRIVKDFLNARGKTGGGSRHLPEMAQAAPSFQILTKRPVTPGEAEVAANPRARSAKLRAAERTAAPAHAAGRSAGLARSLRRDEGRLTMRIIHLFVIGVLVFAAAYVYRIKMESTSRVERVLRLQRRDPRAARRHRGAARGMGQARCAVAAARARRAPSQTEAARRHAIRSVEEPAGAATGLCKARRARSDRRDDQHHRGRRRRAAHHRVRACAGRLSNDRPDARPTPSGPRSRGGSG